MAKIPTKEAALIRRLRELGFRSGTGLHGYQLEVGGGRTIYAGFTQDLRYLSYWSSYRWYEWGEIVIFSTLEELDLALIYVALVNRKRAWSMDWLLKSEGGP